MGEKKWLMGEREWLNGERERLIVEEEMADESAGTTDRGNN